MTAPEPPAPGLGLYFVAMYIKGPTWSPESTPQVVETQKLHLAYNDTLAQRGIYKLRGPFQEPFDSRWRGLLLMKADSLEQAIGYISGDPAVKSGRLAFEISSVWLAAAAFGD